MIYLSADDYGLCREASEHIMECGTLNKISAFVNFDSLEGDSFLQKADAALHINLVEGHAVSDPKEIPLLADDNGYFRHTFTGLFFLSLLQRRELEVQVQKEIRAQLEVWKRIWGEKRPLLLDSHQHTHMIPAIFRALMKELCGEDVKYLRIPAEPVSPYLMEPSLYHTYSIKNLIKQWLLKLLWQIDKKEYRKRKIPTAYFFGILFSGEMDLRRVEKVLPHYIRLAEKCGKDVEVLFHPGYIGKDISASGIAFESFYSSSKRKVEFEAARNLKI